MTVRRLMWYAGTMLMALAMLAASAKSTAPDPQTSTPPGASPVADLGSQ